MVNKRPNRSKKKRTKTKKKNKNALPSQVIFAKEKKNNENYKTRL